MSLVTLGNGRRIGDFMRPYIVAELNTSHFGDVETAKEMVAEAKRVGCDCVKFQSWSTETLYCKSYYKENAIAKRVINKFSLDSQQLLELSQYSAQMEIDFTSTPYSIEEAEFLVSECGVPFVKIASMELDNLPFLTQLGELSIPLVLSTGMGSLHEISTAVEAICSMGNNNVIILHCTSLYPSPRTLIRLQNISGFRNEFPLFPIGYSDHSLGIEIPTASVALGACMIERHFTLDSKRIGMDNQMATEPEEMKDMITACHHVYDAMGGPDRVLEEGEKEQAFKMRRSMVAKVDLSPGQKLQLEHVEFKRPGTGISPTDFQLFLGCKVAKHIESGDIILPDDLS